MSKTSPTAKGALLCVGLLVALAAGYFVLVAPKRHEASRLATEIADTQAQITAAEVGSAPQQPQGEPIRIADLFELSRAMPDTADIPSVLLQLSQISAETGVTFQSITPHDPVPVGSYEQIGIDLVFQGHFYDLSDFLYRLRNLVGVHQGTLDATGRLFSVDSVQFDEGALQFPQVKATLTVSAYVFGDGSPDPIPPGATGSGEVAPATSTPAVPAGTPAASESDTEPIPAVPVGATAAGA